MQNDSGEGVWERDGDRLSRTKAEEYGREMGTGYAERQRRRSMGKRWREAEQNDSGEGVWERDGDRLCRTTAEEYGREVERG